MSSLIKRKSGTFRNSKRVVEVNVGGTVFKLGDDVLSQPEFLNSSLNGLVATNESADKEQSRDASGVAFIDRDGRHFGAIIEFVRTGGDKSVMPKIGTKEFAQMKQEAEYYKITSLVKSMYQLEIQAEKVQQSGEPLPPPGSEEPKTDESVAAAPTKPKMKPRSKTLSISGSLRDLQSRLSSTVGRKSNTLGAPISAPEPALQSSTPPVENTKVSVETHPDSVPSKVPRERRSSSKSSKKSRRSRGKNDVSDLSSTKSAHSSSISSKRSSRKLSSQERVEDDAMQDDSTSTQREKGQLRKESSIAKPKMVHHGRKLAYNLVVVGASGSGKSSILNTLVGKQVCSVGGGQTVGTRSDNVKLGRGAISDTHYISFLDTQGLGADTKVTDAELIQQLLDVTEVVAQMEIVNNVLITLDLTARATRERISNQLMLVRLFQGMREACFLCFTKWNTSGAMAEWNTPLREWIKKHRKAERVEDIVEDPPSFGEIYTKYCAYVLEAMGDTTSDDNNPDSNSFANMGVFLSFFEARVLWVFNLDEVQMEDRRRGELEPYVEVLFTYYRLRCLESLDKAGDVATVDTEEFVKFKQSNTAERGEYFRSLLLQGGEVGPVVELENIDGEEVATRRVSLKSVKQQFSNMTDNTVERIATKDFKAQKHPWDKAFVAADKINTTVTKSTGCVIQ